MARKEVRTCEVCGQQFDGYSTSLYCKECRLVVQRETQRRLREKYKVEKEQARAEAVAKAAEKKARFVPNTEQCEKGCTRWRKLSNGLDEKACHCLYDTKKCRVKDESGKCLSWTDEPVEEKKYNPWTDYTTGESIYAGTKAKHR